MQWRELSDLIAIQEISIESCVTMLIMMIMTTVSGFLKTQQNVLKRYSTIRFDDHNHHAFMKGIFICFSKAQLQCATSHMHG